MLSILCFYHHPCNDGSAAAAALAFRLEKEREAIGDFEIVWCPLSYVTDWEEEFPEEYVEETITPAHPVAEIFIIDVTISKVKFDQVLRYLEQIGRRGEAPPRGICIDHHRTALDKKDEIALFCSETYIRMGPGLSGATLVWEYMNERFGPEPTPELLLYVADQDIWEWKLPDSREINASLNVLDGSYEAMRAELEESMRSPEAWRNRRRLEGVAITAMVDNQVDRSIRAAMNLHIRFFELRVVNATAFSSELGNRLCEQSEHSPDVLAVIYTVQSDWAVKCSVRSVPGGRLTARIFAERYGGGGHDHASGCRFESLDAFRSAIDEIRENGWPEEG
jgi:oligoribonuclease NrnB/cAMP/cGMP phosphodiesterase (DHH superfamily)